ncbi:MAG: hypothetical protein WBB70_15945 [Desulfobacterales bacterium]
MMELPFINWRDFCKPFDSGGGKAVPKSRFSGYSESGAEIPFQRVFRKLQKFQPETYF